MQLHLQSTRLLSFQKWFRPIMSVANLSQIILDYSITILLDWLVINYFHFVSSKKKNELKTSRYRHAASCRNYPIANNR